VPTGVEQNADVDLLTPAMSVVDATDGDGNPEFFWLKPIKDNKNFDGVADPDVYPIIEICPLDPAHDACVDGADPVATFTRTTGDDQDRIKLDDKDQYFAHWRMNSYPPERGGEYRIRVYIPIDGNTDSNNDGKHDGELGFVDVVTLRQNQIKSYGGPLMPISDNGAFKIAFRIEEGALADQFCDFDLDIDAANCAVAFEDPTDGEPTNLQVTGVGTSGGTIVAHVKINDAVFEDQYGNTLSNVVLTAELEQNPPSDLLLDDGVELPFFLEVNTFPDSVFVNLSKGGVEVVICQDESVLTLRGILGSLHDELVLYKVSDDGITRRLPTAEDFSGVCGSTSAFNDTRGFLRKGLSRLAGLFLPKPLMARRLHGGLNTVVSRDDGDAVAFSTFGATLGPNAAYSTADVPATGSVGQTTSIAVQLRTAPQGEGTPASQDFLFGGDDVVATVVSGPNLGATFTVNDNLDGTHTLEYTPTAAGLDEIVITLTTLDGIGPDPIAGGPFTSCVDCFHISFEGGALPGGSTASGFWNVTDGAGITNAAAGGAAQLAPDDGSNGDLPAAPEGQYYLWYGQTGAGNYDNGAANTGSFTTGSGSVPSGSWSLDFQYWYEVESVDVHLFDLMTVDVIDLTTSTTTQELRLNPTVDVNGLSSQPYTSSGFNLAPTWQPGSVDLSAYAGHEIQVRFNFNSGDALYNYFRGWALDDIRLEETGPAPAAGSSMRAGGLQVVPLTGVSCQGIGCDPRAGKVAPARSGTPKIMRR
jgi:hypothetical protein